MAATKITVTLPDQQRREIRALVAAGQSGAVSAFVKHALEIALFNVAGWKEMLAGALQQTGGPLSDQQRRRADSILAPPWTATTVACSSSLRAPWSPASRSPSRRRLLLRRSVSPPDRPAPLA